MTIEEIFSRPAYRRIASVIIFLFIITLWLVRYFYLPSLDSKLSISAPQASAKFIEDLLTSITVSLFVSLLMMWLSPKGDEPKISIIDASELRREFKAGLAESDCWWFYGGCGRYFRSAVLSVMGQRTISESSVKQLNAIILNPGNSKLCENHASYRSATSQGQRDGRWDASRVKCELLATIVLCLQESQKKSLLRVDLYTSDQFSTFRADICTLYAIETREDPKAPAIKCAANSDFYRALRTEFDVLALQSRKIEDPARNCRNVTDLRTLRIAIHGLSIPDLIVDDDEYATILSIIKDPKNPHD